MTELIVVAGLTVAFVTLVMTTARHVRDCSLNRHDFQARYDSAPPPFPARCSGFDAHEIAQVIRVATAKTYVHDVCVGCGKIVKASKAEEA